MTKIEFLSASLTNQLKVKVLCGDGVFDTNDDLTVQLLYELGPSRLTPIVRPVSDLTKPITQADYNGGELFIPIDELKLTTDCENDMDFLDAWEERKYSAIMFPNMPFKFALLLLKWHFNLMDEGIEVVNVTEEFNPYK